MSTGAPPKGTKSDIAAICVQATFVVEQLFGWTLAACKYALTNYDPNGHESTRSVEVNEGPVEDSRWIGADGGRRLTDWVDLMERGRTEDSRRDEVEGGREEG
ncbi:hypothetical protein CH63R_08314 [Colletotrichum higginsianum IMI 349063]|uniref:Uncharacterized protein n=1 Tax=Colletotrichum higginsianum (strain IMI 349063) TaxID=759273 RepID=A0A1B7YBY0_COLHI|nr:hypothetical protein CH63R_08314 [Colletotrichum higginsianum IMI 349063]OBR09549.1 hypothetical protein CH63R_08314 [Colletotrichum higginsianum IMI 349063]GJC96378.1 hypothetical protein ColKHC_05204 [Colletotrichum higginsianum]